MNFISHNSYPIRSGKHFCSIKKRFIFTRLLKMFSKHESIFFIVDRLLQGQKCIYAELTPYFVAYKVLQFYPNIKMNIPFGGTFSGIGSKFCLPRNVLRMNVNLSKNNNEKASLILSLALVCISSISLCMFITTHRNDFLARRLTIYWLEHISANAYEIILDLKYIKWKILVLSFFHWPLTRIRL